MMMMMMVGGNGEGVVAEVWGGALSGLQGQNPGQEVRGRSSPEAEEI